MCDMWRTGFLDVGGDDPVRNVAETMVASSSKTSDKLNKRMSL